MISNSSSVVGSHSMSSGIGASGASMWPSGEPKTLSQLDRQAEALADAVEELPVLDQVGVGRRVDAAPACIARTGSEKPYAML